MRRIALVGASLALLGGMTAACGGAPDDASKDDFCEAAKKVQSAQDFDEVKDAVDELKDVGTPEGISDEARDGFEVLIDLAEDSDDQDEFDEKGEDLSDEDDEAGMKFFEYVGETCSD